MLIRNVPRSFPMLSTMIPWFSHHQTNRDVDLCKTEPGEGEPDLRKDHRKAKKRSLGHIILRDPAFKDKHIHGMVGLMGTMGQTKKTRMRKHWSRAKCDDYPLVRMCMQRDLSELLYSRFLHCSDGSAPPRVLPNGDDNPAFDSKHYIRRDW